MSRRDLLRTGAATLAGLAVGNPVAAASPAASAASPPVATTPPLPAPTTTRGRMSGKRALMEQLLADGVSHVFGNPGSTEQGFMDALADYPQIRFVLALHEGAAVSMADAYARATGRPAFVELHTAAGLGNAVGMIRNARLTNTPLVVFAGHNDTRALFQEPNLSGPLVEMARPVVKWAAQVEHAHDVAPALRRAFKLAAEPPAGPVFLSLPLNVLEDEAEVEIRPTAYPAAASRPDPGALEAAARLLLAAERPLFMVGDGVGHAGAHAEAVAVAELLGLPVFSLTSTTAFNFPAGHPLNLGSVFYVKPDGLRDTLRECDLLLAVGARLFPVTFPEPNPAPLLPAAARLVQVDDDPAELSKNVPAAVGLLAHPRAALAGLAETLRRLQTEDGRRVAAARAERTRAEVERRRADTRRRAAARREQVPIAVPRLMEELRAALPANALVYSESVSNEPHVEAGLPAEAPWQLLRTGGQGLGACLPGCIGLALGRPERKIVGICGDGTAMYSVAALWSAAHLHLPVTYLILGNGAYHVLKTTLVGYYGEERMRGRRFVGMDLHPPELRFDRIAESFGVRGFRVEAPGELAGTLRAALAHPGPALVDVRVEAPFATAA